MRRVVLSLLLLCSAGSAIAQAGHDSLDVAGKKHSYSYYLPKSTTPPALLVGFHDTGRNSKDVISSWSKLADKENFAVVALDAYDVHGWNGQYDGEAIGAILDAFTSAHPVDRSHVYLFGNGSGGNFALALTANGGGNFFAATAVFASALKGNLSTLEQPGPRIPVGFWSGTKAGSSFVQSVKNTVSAFKKAGYDTTWTEMPGEENTYEMRSDRVNAAVWEFLKTKSLQ